MGAWEEETKLAEFGIEPAPAEKSDVTSDALSEVVRVAANTLGHTQALISEHEKTGLRVEVLAAVGVSSTWMNFFVSIRRTVAGSRSRIFILLF